MKNLMTASLCAFGLCFAGASYAFAYTIPGANCDPGNGICPMFVDVNNLNLDKNNQIKTLVDLKNKVNNLKLYNKTQRITPEEIRRFKLETGRSAPISINDNNHVRRIILGRQIGIDDKEYLMTLPIDSQGNINETTQIMFVPKGKFINKLSFKK